MAAKNEAENITMVLYPNAATENGRELRLRQQYFLASASLQDILRNWVKSNGNDFSQFADKHCFQLNDTHPAIAVPELMRLLMDHHGLTWNAAWNITTSTMAYTNHTLLPEALETWPVFMFEQLLPRVLEIIYEINVRFLTEVSRRWPGDTGILGRMASETGQMITWEDALASNIELAPGLDDFTMDSEPPVKPDADGNYPIALPGVKIAY